MSCESGGKVESMTIFSSIAKFAATFFGFDMVRESTAALLARDERFLNDMGLTRGQAVELSGVPQSYFGLRAPTILAAYEHNVATSYAR